MNPIKLTDFARMLEAGIRDQFGQSSYWVTGELSNLKIYENKGHLYFHLVEKDASTGIVSAELSCVGFNAAYASVRAFEEATGQPFSNGIEILVQVIVAFHPVKGLKLQLQHVDVNYSAGKIQQQRKLSIKKLVDENPDAAQIIDGQLFTRNQSHQLPLAFRKLAVILIFRNGKKPFSACFISKTIVYYFLDNFNLLNNMSSSRRFNTWR